MARIRTYSELLAYLNRIEPANGRPMAWAQERLTTMASRILYELGGHVPAEGVTITWKNRPKPGGYRCSTLELEIKGKIRPGRGPFTLDVFVPA